MDALNRRNRGKRSGFTLIEILVVVAILAIAAGIAVLTIDRDERGGVAREARQLAGALEYAAARAQMRSEMLGLSADGTAWRFWTRKGDRWTALRDDEALAAHALPASMRVVAVSYAGRALEAGAIVPLRPSGRNEPFVVALSTSGWRAAVAADPLNRVSIAGPEPVQ